MVNKSKILKLKELYKIGFELTNEYLKKIWQLDTAKYANSSLYELSVSTMTARFKQLCCKKALDIKRSITKKIDIKKYIILKLERKEKNIKNENSIKKLAKIIEKLNKIPVLKNFSLDLNSNFVEFFTTKKGLYRQWIHISSLGKEYNMNIPFLKTKIYNKFVSNNFQLSNFISISNNIIKVVFTKKISYKENGKEFGCDIGLNNVLTLSNGIQTNSLNNKSLPSLHHKLNNRTKGSIRYHETIIERDNYIKYAINKIDFSDIKVLYLEDIKYLRFKKHCSKFLRCWRYALIF